jgi:hypothetical protein
VLVATLTPDCAAADTRTVEPDHDLGGPGALERLQEEEQSLSARRTRLHDRIDFVRSGGAGDGPAAENLLQELERQERELSERRRELHRHIELVTSRVLEPSSEG